MPLEGPVGVRLVRRPLSGETMLAAGVTSGERHYNKWLERKSCSVCARAVDSQRRHPSVESDESLGYHWGSWLGEGSQLWEGLTEGDDVSSLELSLLLSLAGERAASSPARRRPMRAQRLERALSTRGGVGESRNKQY